MHGLLLLAGVSLLSFVLVELAPGDYFAEMRLDPRISEATVHALRARYGLDRPLPERYGRWLASLAKGELGYSFAYGQPVGPLLWPRLRNTLLLTVTATALAWLLAVPLGTWWATRRRGPADAALTGLTAMLLALPDLVLVLGLLLLAVRTGWFPTGGMVSLGHEQMPWGARVKDVAFHLVLPVAALVLGIVPALVRYVRASVADALGAPFVRAARAHGIPERRVLFRHALPAAANPLVSLFGLSLAGLLSMSLLVEVVMSWPGLGPLFLEAILARDFHLVLGPVLASTFLLLGGNLLADLLLAATDPRIRTEER
ncbi:MAG: ABC transporter substrate-binding protein [Acidobacteria bacterium]|nr:MAG: ABC transporter substrate-binding protein [Acidobacteriota bacterium]